MLRGQWRAEMTYTWPLLWSCNCFDLNRASDVLYILKMLCIGVISRPKSKPFAFNVKSCIDFLNSSSDMSYQKILFTAFRINLITFQSFYYKPFLDKSSIDYAQRNISKQILNISLLGTTSN